MKTKQAEKPAGRAATPEPLHPVGQALAEDLERSIETPETPIQQASSAAGRSERLQKKSEWSNWGVLTVIVLCFFVIVYFRPANSSNPQRRAGIGQRLPKLQLQPLTGSDRPLRLADLTGHVVLLNFWGPWDAPSCDQLPQIASLGRTFGDHPAFKLVSVSCGRATTQGSVALRQDTAKLLKQRNAAIRTYGDPGGASRAAVDKVVGSRDLPTTVILDRLGRIRGVWSGSRPDSRQEMENLINRLLAEG